MKDGFHTYCKKCLKAHSIEWAKINPELLSRYQKKYKRNRYHTKLKFDPRFKLDNSLGRAVWKALKGNKRGRRWEILVGYTLDDLMKWLEQKFSNGMTWQNYGCVWHVDHITPQSWFNYTSPHDPEFKECWNLSNLQPMLAKKNTSKGNKYVG